MELTYILGNNSTFFIFFYIEGVGGGGYSQGRCQLYMQLACISIRVSVNTTESADEHACRVRAHEKNHRSVRQEVQRLADADGAHHGISVTRPMK